MDMVDATGSQSSNRALDGLTGTVLASVVPTAALFSQVITQVVDFYLDSDQEETREHIVRLAEQGDNVQIIPFIFEASYPSHGFSDPSDPPQPPANTRTPSAGTGTGSPKSPEGYPCQSLGGTSHKAT
jgi:hypothetical protein